MYTNQSETPVSIFMLFHMFLYSNACLFRPPFSFYIFISDSSIVLTTNGRECIFPFTFEGVVYTSCAFHVPRCFDCTNYSPWCNVWVHGLALYLVNTEAQWEHERGNMWDYCDVTTHAGTAPIGSSCTFPFYANREYTLLNTNQTMMSSVSAMYVTTVYSINGFVRRFVYII